MQVLGSQAEILPAASSPLGKLWSLVNSTNSSLDECAEIIQLDAALSARIMRVANSGAYGANAENIKDGVLRLGLKFVREQVFTATVFKQYSAWTLPKQWDLFWLRNIFTARLCERMAGSLSMTNGSEYLAGLIHDAGWLLVATYFPDEFRAMAESGRAVGLAEGEFLPFSHADIGAALAKRSMMPERAIHAIRMHHDPVITDGASPIPPDRDDLFLPVILSLCDSIADSWRMDIFTPCQWTIEEMFVGSRVTFLNNYGIMPDLRALAEEELAKSKEIYKNYFVTA